MRDDFWDADEITGNGSGSYTFSRSVAKEYVLENIDLIEELCDEGLATVEMVGEKFISEDWEWMDVCIRCYLLSYAISNVLNSHADEWNIKD
jgi:hypothetical protein